MNTVDLLSHLRRLNVRIWVEDQHVRYSAPKGVLSPDLQAEIANRKEELRVFLHKAKQAARSSLPPITPAGHDQHAPLSLPQLRLWFLDHLHPKTPAYNIVVGFSIVGTFDQKALEQGLQTIMHRHEILRTSFPSIQGEPKQVVSPSLPSPCQVIDLRSVSQPERLARAQHIALEESRRSFNLTEGPLWKLSLVQIANDLHHLILTMHHIISDGWSLRTFFWELSTLYRDFTTGNTTTDLEPLPIQYKDFAYWQHQSTKNERIDEQLTYWKNQLLNHSGLLELPTDRPRPPVQSFRGKQEPLILSAELTERLKRFSHHEQVTVFMTVLAAFQTLLYRYTGQEQILVGTPVAGRNRWETEGLIGLFVNSLPIRTLFSGNPSFRELLRQVRQSVIDAHANQDVPFEKIVETVNPERNLSHSPLFQVMFVFEQNLQHLWRPSSKLTISPLAIDNETAKFDLTLFLEETQNGLIGKLEYSTDLFDQDRIARMARHFLTVIENALAYPDEQISAIPILSAAEQHQILTAWNDTEVSYPAHLCMHELFEQQVERSPQATAIVSGKASLTYQDLNAQSNQLAHYLMSSGVGPESLVGICLERSLDMMVGLWGILKAGGAYVPLDPALPPARLHWMANDAKLSLVITHEKHRHKFLEAAIHIVLLDSQRDQLASQDARNPTNQVSPQNLAYVMYTSGSTGMPKGVMVEHQSVVNYLTWCTTYYPLKDGMGAPHHSSLSFDLSLTSVFAPLLAGKRVILFPEDRNAGELPALWDLQEPLSILKVTPSQLQILNSQIALRSGLPAIQALILGGEALDGQTIRPWRTAAPHMRVINEYGPTETVVGCCIYEVPLAPGMPEGPVPIGRPIANTQLYILDSHLRPVPIGVPGELFIGGHGLARGYLRQPELTNRRFIPNPFNPSPGTRLYRTGDRARYLSDGNIEFLGRLDRQCKIRGYRIEPAEIEAALKMHAQLRDAVVTVREDQPGDKRLIAYLLPMQQPFPDVDALHKALKTSLPEYMVPSAFVVLDDLPLTSSGKVDYARLPSPKPAASDKRIRLIPPRDELELQLTKIWEKLLGTAPIGITENFFDLGGHSLLIVKLVDAMEKALGRSLPLSILFQAPTIEQLSHALRSEGCLPTWSSLVPIQPSGSKRPFFCVHEGTGDVMCYRELAMCLGMDQPFFGLQPVGLDGKNLPHNRVEDMVTHYLQEMRCLQPEGPYFLGGLCFGVYIALEMARKLQAEGENVGLLVCFDTFGGLVVKKRRLQTFPSSAKWKAIKNIPTKTANAFSYLRSLAGKNRGTRKLPAKLRFLQQLLVRLIACVYLKLEVPLPFGLRRLRILNAIEQARRTYDPGVFSGRMILFQSTAEWRGYTNPAETWAESVLGGVEIYHVPGGHIGMLKQPHVQILAKELSRCLEQGTPGRRDSFYSQE